MAGLAAAKQRQPRLVAGPINRVTTQPDRGEQLDPRRVPPPRQ